MTGTSKKGFPSNGSVGSSVVGLSTTNWPLAITGGMHYSQRDE